ncbi:sensor domain-containing phosphodiesterase [Cyanobium sp. L1E-Cus]|uniref:sensor domain-containing diguanylate cyclase n=1 Tax=Cyanobium sp. L1E-Cus TaxID=2823714 RepID=UPI0020CD8EB5|nr:sensor domain-containing phosphodiesterase [Cyanobium sp. L1E-Cus]MCP9821756.1 sensor domain-containing phosphodiesterase [Cyanobium sp. L1E-Cus]
MQEAPIPEDDSARLKELQSYGVLDTQSEAIFDDITHLVQDITGAKIGVISLIDENRQWFKSCVGLEDAPKETPRNISFCGHTIVQRRPLIINDALEDDRFADNPLVLGEPRIRFYAGFPLIAANGMALGSLCAIDIVPKALTPKQVKSLERLARQVVSQMELRREAHLLQSAELALQAQGGNGQVKQGIQLLSEINPVMDREQLLQMLSLLLELDQPPCFTLARCKFKEYSRVNATLGTAAANSLVQTGLERLRSCLPVQASTTCFSDDELVIVLPHLSEEGAITAIAERCIDSLEAPLKLNDRDIELGVSMGIAIFKNNYSDAGSLLSDASIAQRIAITDRSKNSNFNFIDLSARQAAQQHYQVETDLRRAIRRNEITPYMQPIVDLATGKPVGLECLMRWRTDSGEMMLPNNFLRISHLAGLSGELDLQIIQKAMQASHELASAAPGRPLQLSVNLSALLLESEGQRQRLLQLIRSTPLPKDWQLQVELVEDYLQDNGSELAIFLNALRRQGVAIAIDDFGTGYSSLSRLHNYPVRAVKVDCSFVERIDGNSNPSNKLLKTIQNLCADLDLESTAEGIETESQRAWLLQNGYKYGQGYLFSGPMSVAATGHYLAEIH